MINRIAGPLSPTRRLVPLATLINWAMSEERRSPESAESPGQYAR